jgi:hypothetical protein
VCNVKYAQCSHRSQRGPRAQPDGGEDGGTGERGCCDNTQERERALLQAAQVEIHPEPGRDSAARSEAERAQREHRIQSQKVIAGSIQRGADVAFREAQRYGIITALGHDAARTHK